MEQNHLYILLESKEFPKNLENFICYGFTLHSEDQDKSSAQMSTAEGLERMDKFMQSAFAYGSTPFLYQLYGIGELSQAFCRLAAVNGAIYILNRNPDHLVITDDKICTGISSKGQILNSKWVVAGPDYLSQYLNPHHKVVSKFICITAASLKQDDYHIQLLIPPNTVGNRETVYILQTAETVSTAPTGKFVLHFSMLGYKTAEEDLLPIVSRILKFNTDGGDSDTRPLVLWHTFFNQNIRSFNKLSLPANLLVCSDPSIEPGFQDVLTEAKALFERMYPGEEFLPKMPEPEEVEWMQEPISEPQVFEQKQEEVAPIITPSNEKPIENTIVNSKDNISDSIPQASEKPNETTTGLPSQDMETTK